MQSYLKWLLILICGVWSSFAVGGDAVDFRLRTVPAVPIAGQPFTVQADGTSCVLLFLNDPIGSGQIYSQVTVSPGLIQAQVGYEPTLLPPCENAPHTVSLAVPGQPAGTYRLELRGRPLFSSGSGTDLLQAVDITVAAGAPAFAQAQTVPAAGSVSLGLLFGAIAILAFIAMSRRGSAG